MFDAHPAAGKWNHVGAREAAETQIKICWQKLTCPARLSRGPIQNLARRLHVKLAPVTAVALADSREHPRVVRMGS